MDTVPYTFHSHRETGTVDAVQPVPGLFVYQLPEHLRHPYYPWLLGHTSGKCIAAFERYGHAMEAADIIADFTDWTRTADELIADVDAYTLCDRIESFTAGLFVSAKPLDVEQAA
ncbi:hypothetical protein HZZ00_10915 [Streptomyces sp. NEAU-sy36]|uniref:hypothetical protein n=1 Tax=unclassified Streptomyces TaxID=2593676 RepID=UPI0015D59176|nr:MULTISPECIES: hypothetical protein [unclassified Streptomyces]QLJ01481.1 hypothetical protein HZZ00_10915 [Streptomyces sp. NEAU-sy36]